MSTTGASTVREAITYTPVAVTGLSSVTAIAGGGGHNLAVQNGGVYAWGKNLQGQLGNGTTTSSTTPVAVTGLSSGVTAIAAGVTTAWPCRTAASTPGAATASASSATARRPTAARPLR